MADDSIPPSHRGSFRSSDSFNTMSTRLGPFTINQILKLHLFHAEMYEARNVGCDLTFGYGQNYARAMYELTCPVSEGNNIKFELIEQRTAPGVFSYSVDCKINGRVHSTQTVVKGVTARDGIPEEAFHLLRMQMVDLNSQVFTDKPLERDFDALENLLGQRKPH